jgi:hypothetical protein
LVRRNFGFSAPIKIAIGFKGQKFEKTRNLIQSRHSVCSEQVVGESECEGEVDTNSLVGDNRFAYLYIRWSVQMF